MRCKNCGWPNKPSETSCVKCGSPLEAEQFIPESQPGGQYEVSSPGVGDGDGRAKTVLESNVFGMSDTFSRETLPADQPEANVCPNCHYPLRPDATKCPNCKQPIVRGHDSNAHVNLGFQRQPTRMSAAVPSSADAPAPTRKLNVGTGSPFKGTINPYMMNYQPDPAFILQPLQRMNERKVPEAVELELNGNELILNRENTEPGNSSITSHEQALITYSEGRWYIEDRSEQHTTFVQAAEKIGLHDGDIILLGNRLFRFQEQK